MVTTGVLHLARTRWLRRAGAAAVATAVLGLGSTGLAVAVLAARQPDTSSDPQAANTSGTTSSSPSDDQGSTGDQSTSGLGQADQDAPAQGGSNGS
ncbi:hypothetical protein [Kribbella sp. DT2]|uniref:hypothetical protein n=1 Tax=Kribbella sp. DT2 TaxID=3393427 RepID=UPI003CF80E82